MLEWADLFYNWALNDPKIGGMIAYYWQSNGEPYYEIGAVELPSVAAKYAEIGNAIIGKPSTTTTSSSTTATSDSPIVRATQLLSMALLLLSVYI